MFYILLSVVNVICVNDGDAVALWTKCLVLNTMLYSVAVDLPHSSQANCNLRGLEVEFKDSKRDGNW